MARISLLAAVLVAALALGSVDAKKWRKKGGHKYTKWMDSHGTFYEASNAAGMAGGCGYGNVYVAGYGDQTAAASKAIWNDGQSCGACYEVMCVSSKWCRPGARTVITVTNHCPYGSEGGWCNGNKVHLDMAKPAWSKIGKDPKAGVLSTRMRRVPCKRSGGVKFQISGNPWFLMVMISNVGGPGDLRKVEVKGDKGDWKELKHNWGAIYSGSSPGNHQGLSFRLTSLTATRTTTCWNVAPKGWSIGSTYQGDCQFRR